MYFRVLHVLVKSNYFSEPILDNFSQKAQDAIKYRGPGVSIDGAGA